MIIRKKRLRLNQQLSHNLLLILFSIFISNTSVFAQKDSTNKVLTSEDISKMSLKELVNLKVTSTSITQTKNKISPLPVIVISKNDIELSGARNLDELLEIYVPGFNMMYKGWTSHSIGVRGIIGDRNNKVLLLVNGKAMNGRALLGAVSERHLSMLNDIEKIEVIQSPQTSLYGSGAISSVINIYTKNGESKGATNEIEFNQGFIDYFSNVQVRHSKKLTPNLSYSAFYGGDYATGASQENSPTKFSFNTSDGNGDTIIAGQPVQYPINNLNGSNLNKSRHKFHGQIDYKKWSTWFRYTNGGMNFSPSQVDIMNRDETQTDSSVYQYKHITAFTSYKNNWGKWGIDGRLSYDQFSNRIQNRTETLRRAKKNRENELYSRVIFNYQSEKISLGFGPAVSFEKFGLPAYGSSENEWLLNPRMDGYSFDENASDSVNAYHQSWSTIMLSGIGEAQYSLSENLNLLGSVRIDKHTYTGVMTSPRASIVWKPNDTYLARLQYSKSNRRQDDADLRFEYLSAGEDKGLIETIDYVELSGDIILNQKIVIRPSVYYSDYHIVAWGGRISKSIGDLQYYGAELSAIYKGEKGYGKISHNFVKIHDFKNVEDEKNNVSASAYGYGSSFHNFPDHLTKLFYQYKINEQSTINTSLQITWYLKGAEDNSRYNADSLDSHIAWDLSNGETMSYRPSAFLNAGYVYKFNSTLKGSIFGYNLLGILNEDLNKRVEFQKTSHYRIQPTSVAIRLNFSF